MQRFNFWFLLLLIHEVDLKEDRIKNFQNNALTTASEEDSNTINYDFMFHIKNVLIHVNRGAH